MAVSVRFERRADILQHRERLRRPPRRVMEPGTEVRDVALIVGGKHTIRVSVMSAWRRRGRHGYRRSGSWVRTLFTALLTG